MPQQAKFNVFLVAAIREGLNSIGPSISDIVLFHLQRNNAIHPDQSSIDPEAFDDGLKRIFGFGAKVIERRILEVLYVKLDASVVLNEDFEFIEEVRKAQQLLHPDGLVPVDAQVTP